MAERAAVTGSENPYRGADGRYHFVYRTEHEETGEYYIGKHSTADLDDGYLGSGDWTKLWRVFAPDQLNMRPIRFFDSEEAAYLGERQYLAEIRNDSLRRNVNEGGEGRTSEDMRRTFARPEVKRRHKAGVDARWAKQEERDRASVKARLAFGKPGILEKYYTGSALRWDNPKEREKHGDGQRKRFSNPEEKKKQSARTRDYAAAHPDARARNSRQKTELWADPVRREKMLAAQRAGKAKMPAGPRAKPVETPEGAFPSLTAAAEHFGIPRKRGARLVRKGEWRYLPKGTADPQLEAGRALDKAGDAELAELTVANRFGDLEKTNEGPRPAIGTRPVPSIGGGQLRLDLGDQPECNGTTDKATAAVARTGYRRLSRS